MPRATPQSILALSAPLLLEVLVLFLAGCRSARPAESVSATALAPNAVQQTTIGRSVEDRPIEMIRFGSGPHVILVIGGIHGSEAGGFYVAERLVEQLRATPIPAGRTVAVIPRANPDGCARHVRANAHGVDINRNFPAANWAKSRRGSYYGGLAALSEPETVALTQAIEQTNPELIISLHSIEAGRHCNNFDGPAADVAAELAARNHYPVTRTMGYATPGSLGSYAGVDRHIATITLELPRTLPDAQAWSQNRQALWFAVAGEDLANGP